MAKKAGRPRKPKDEARVPGISVRLTKDERGPIDTAIKRSGLSQSDWARKSLLYVATSDICITWIEWNRWGSDPYLRGVKRRRFDRLTYYPTHHLRAAWLILPRVHHAARCFFALLFSVPGHLPAVRAGSGGVSSDLRFGVPFHIYFKVLRRSAFMALRRIKSI